MQFLKEKQVSHYFSIKISTYIKDLLRLFCLMEYDRDIDEGQRKQIEIKILEIYKKWRWEYFIHGKDRIIRKLSVMLFPYCKTVWRKLANKFYFIKNNRNIMQ